MGVEYARLALEQVAILILRARRGAQAAIFDDTNTSRLIGKDKLKVLGHLTLYARSLPAHKLMPRYLDLSSSVSTAVRQYQPSHFSVSGPVGGSGECALEAMHGECQKAHVCNCVCHHWVASIVRTVF